MKGAVGTGFGEEQALSVPTTVPTNPPTAHAFIDESGTTSDSSFVVAMFCTLAVDAWRKRVQAALDAERYTNALHFKEISGTNRRHGRFLVSKRLIDNMAATRDWWAHYTYVDRKLVDTTYFSGSADIEYNKWLADLVRWRTKRAGMRYEVLIAHRDRLRNDDFIPARLQAELVHRAAYEGMPEVTVGTARGRSDRMLQVADLVVSAVRQLYVPSTNALKRELAADIDALIARNRPAGMGTIRPFEWKPWSLLKA